MLFQKEQSAEKRKSFRKTLESGALLRFPGAFAPIVPLLANMTEIGKSKLLDFNTLQDLGYNSVIYSVTNLGLALKPVEEGLREIRGPRLSYLI